MFDRYFLISAVALIGSLTAVPSFSTHYFFFEINTLPGYTGEQLTLKSDWTLYNEFTGSIGPKGFALIMAADQSTPMPAADLTVTTSDGSATCLIHVAIGWPGEAKLEVSADPTCSPQIVFNPNPVANPRGDCNTTELTCYRLDFSVLPPQKK